MHKLISRLTRLLQVIQVVSSLTREFTYDRMVTSNYMQYEYGLNELLINFVISDCYIYLRQHGDLPGPENQQHSYSYLSTL